MITKAIIPAAGRATRMMPASKVLPKTMLPIINRPALSYIIEEAYLSGIKDVILIVNPEGLDLIRNYYGYEFNLNNEGFGEDSEQDRIINIKYIIQKESKGLGHAIYLAKDFIDKDENFAVMLSDETYITANPVLKRLINISKAKDAPVIATFQVDEVSGQNYGNCVLENNSLDPFKIVKLVEKPKVILSNYAISGRYVLNEKIFEMLADSNANSTGELELTTALNQYASQFPFYGTSIEDKRFDVGNPLGFIETIINYGLNRTDTKEDVLALLKEYI